MSYPRDIDDYSDSELRQELERREILRKGGVCDYCERRGTDPTCKHDDRHLLAKRNLLTKQEQSEKRRMKREEEA